MTKAEKAGAYTIRVTALLTISIFVFLFLFICYEGLPVFTHTSVYSFLFSHTWNPLADVPAFGIGAMIGGGPVCSFFFSLQLAMIGGTLYVSFLSVFFALPIGAGCAFFIEFCTPSGVKGVILAFIDMLAGVPSVIFGFIGLTVVVKGMERIFDLATGECILSAALVLAVMILPFIVANCAESVESGRRLYEDAVTCLGIDKWYFMSRLLLPHVKNALLVSLILSFARAMGETMAVMMVMGNAAAAPRLLDKGESVPALIALEMGSAEYGSPHYEALYAAGMVLMAVLILSNILFYMFRKSAGEDTRI